MLLLIGNVHFDNSVKRNTMDLSSAFYTGVVPGYDGIFPNHAEVAACREYLPRGGN
jgi:hypothetical protein